MIDQQTCGTQTMSLLNKTSCTTTSTQTEPKSPTLLSPASKATPSKKPSKQSVSTKEETHLLATIRGMRVDLAIKEKAMQRLTRELDECKKTIKKLQKENESREKMELLHFQYLNIFQTIFSFSFCIDNRSDKNLKKPYDPAQFTEKLNPSNVQLQEKIKLLEMDYKSLHAKRLQDVSEN